MRIVVVGDSISEGIGSKKVNYIDQLKKLLEKKMGDIQIINLSLTGTTIDYASLLVDQIHLLNPDYIIIMYGSVDLQIRPNMELNRYSLISITPKRYKNIKGMLNPRPFYSSKWQRLIPDRIDNLYRKIWKKILYKTQGTMQYLNSNQFNEKYRKFLSEINGHNVVICSTIYLDEKIYYGSCEEYIRCNRYLQTLALETKSIWVDIFSELYSNVELYGWNYCYYKDHFHPNKQGYDIIARLISEKIM